MTPRQQVLLLTKEYLEQGSPFICAILDHVAHQNPGLRDEAARLHAGIQAGIDRMPTLGQWIARQLGMGHLDYDDMPEPYCNMFGNDWLTQQARLAWIDRLLEACRA
jgi:hypothetical protein